MRGEALLLSLASVAAVLALGVPVVFWLAQDSLIFVRQPLAEARRQDLLRRFPALEERWIDTADGARLHAWYVRAPSATPAPLIIYFGGNAEDASGMLDWVGDPLAGETPGHAWLIADYRGYGLSTGAPSEAALFADALLLYDEALKLPGIDPRRVFVYGRSLGSGVAVHLASQRALAAAVLVTPYDSMVAVARRHYPFLPVNSILRHRFESIALAQQLKLPLLALVAERDALIPPEHALRLVAAWGGATRTCTVAGADHNSIALDAGFWAEIRRFLERPGS